MSVLRRVYRERRRLSLTAMLLFVTGVLMFRGVSIPHPLPAPVAAGLAFAGAGVITGLVVALLLPRLRVLVECFALYCLLISASGALWPRIVLWPDAAYFVFSLSLMLGPWWLYITPRLPIRTTLAMWIDDSHGRAADRG